ncbi:MAG: hypothetical protein HY775_08545 [Acidobacteria bacterium]|nr:hypothetical protein [Acidobacteriota bacterium]
MRVRIPAPSTVSNEPEGNLDISIEGSGRFKGLVLVQDVPPDDQTILVAVRVPEDALCGATYCPATPLVATEAWGPGAELVVGEQLPLPAGTYRLYVMAEGGPVSITLRLHGLTGSTSLRPTKPARLFAWDWKPKVPMSPYQLVFSDWATFDIGREQIDGTLLWRVNSPVLGPNRTQRCFYVTNPDPPVGFLPGCPYADMTLTMNWWFVGTIPYASLSFATGRVYGPPSPPMRESIAIWSEAASPVEKIGGIGFSLTLRE